MPVVALLLSLLLGTAALVMLLRGSPGRLLRPYRDPRLSRLGA
ncbi:hypothetical protein [Nannocystis sp. SCPEA4]|nr:hypothetical protein [Nannocystis sp. SCPEA4]MCY1056344.1 hypothetical protein [Nannocystis sp. SCPEA4]